MIKDWFKKWAVYSPNKVAVKEYETGRTFTYKELNDLCNGLAYYIAAEFGLKKGDRVAILAENCLEYILLFGVAQKMGCILVPMNYRLAASEINFLLENAAPQLLITSDSFRDLAHQALTYESIPYKWSIEEMTHYCEKKLKYNGFYPFPNVDIAIDDPIFLLYTSGTTGFPKGAIYTHKMLFWNSINTSVSLIVNSESRTINCMPFFHTGGWNVLLTPFLHHGGFVCIMKQFDAKVILELIASEKPTIFMGVPTMLKMIAEEAKFDTTDFSSLYYILVGGEPMPIPLIETWHAKKVYIRQGFGMTEVGPNLTSLHQDDAIRKKGSIGRPNFYVEIKIVDEKGNEVAENQSGELLLKGPMVTPGYWKNEMATQKAIKDSWFATGDLLKRDEEGYLFVVDRIKNMYISGGENVYPAEVERVIIEHPAVSEVAIIGVPDDRWGEVGKAFITCKKSVAAAEILALCQAQLAKFKVPKSVVFLDELPKNDTGKINRKVLSEGDF
jgi:fatty-acyl-CoA synthase